MRFTQSPPIQPRLEEMFRSLPPDQVAHELALLRNSIDTLIQLLNPPKSVIITGPEAERIFSSLTQEKHHG